MTDTPISSRNGQAAEVFRDRPPKPSEPGWLKRNIPTVVGWAFIIVSGLYWASTDRAHIVSSVNANTAMVEDHETRIRSVEHTLDATVATFSTDLKWIRDELKKLREDLKQPKR